MKAYSIIYMGIYIFMLTALFSCNTEKEHSNEILLSDGWKVQSSLKANVGGEVISSKDAIVEDWYEAKVPSTIMGVLTDNGLYADAFESTNYKNIDRTQFDSSWWYRKEFKLDKLNSDNNVILELDGLSFSANIWLNGKLVANKDEIRGTFRRFNLDITNFVADNNVLAIEVFKAQNGDPNIGFVDWNPRPADESMGLFREIRVQVSNSVRLSNSFVHTKVNTESLDEAWIYIETQLKNFTDKEVVGELKGYLENQTFSFPITLKANEEKIVKLGSEETSMLHMKNPRLWWCNNLGTPELYDLKLEFVVNNQVSDKEELKFGVREIKDYFTDNGYRGFILNGKKVLIKGAGWTDDIFLRDTPKSNEIQVKYVKDMGMNTIRFESIWGTSQNIYDMCDKYGLLAMVGWSCHWEWENYMFSPENDFGCINSPDDIELVSKYFVDQVTWLRNHPSIICWMGASDKLPNPDLEKIYLKLCKELDTRPYLNSAKEQTSSVSGPSGTKMFGPYEYVAPNYWYEDKKFGGAYGFNTETGIGAQLPVIESIQKFIPSDKMWPLNEAWDYHCTASSSHMNNLNVLNKVLEQKLGTPKDLNDFLKKADFINYDGTKAMFEAFRANLPNTTGIIQWMLNSAWPSLYWQLYDYYLIPTASYYAVKKANAPPQLVYDYKDNSLIYINETEDKSDKLACIKILSKDSKIIYEVYEPITGSEQLSSKVFDFNKSLVGSTDIFLNLELRDSNNLLVAENFYAIPAEKDEYYWDQTDWCYTPSKKYSNMKYVSALPQAEVKTQVTYKQENNTIVAKVTITNVSDNIAFQNVLKLKDGKGEIIYPVFWSDNYISLLPAESKTITCTIEKDLFPAEAVIEISGWNIPNQIL